MRTHLRLARPQRTSLVVRKLSRPVVLKRADITQLPDRQGALAAADIHLASAGFQPDPYLDYGRFLTPEGGVLFIYKDLDLRLRHTLWRLFAWTIATGFEGWYILDRSPLHSDWLKVACLLAVGVVNWLIVAKPVEVYRKIEIRPDCLIIEDAGIFWLRHMEAGWPGFRPDSEGNQVLCGAYGTRFVEYLTLRRFDEHDRMPEVFATHLQEAMGQLWIRPQ